MRRNKGGARATVKRKRESESAGAQENSICKVFLLSKGKRGQPVDFWFSFAVGNFCSHSEIKFIPHIFLKPLKCPFF